MNYEETLNNAIKIENVVNKFSSSAAAFNKPVLDMSYEERYKYIGKYQKKFRHIFLFLFGL